MRMKRCSDGNKASYFNQWITRRLKLPKTWVDVPGFLLLCAYNLLWHQSAIQSLCSVSPLNSVEILMNVSVKYTEARFSIALYLL